MTGNIAIFWPMIVQAFLTFVVYVVFTVRRGGSSDSAKGNAASRNLINQFELPVLFYVVCLALYVTNGASWYGILIAWAFALSRLVHAVVHLGSNDLKQRGLVFAIGMAAVMLLWLILALHVANVPGALGGPRV